MFSSRVGEAELQLHQSFLILTFVGSDFLSFDFHRNNVFCGMTNCNYMIAEAPVVEVGRNGTGPHVQLLPHATKRRRCTEIEAETPEMHSVRVGTQIVGGIALSAFLPELRRIGFLMSAVEVMIFQSLFRPGNCPCWERSASPIH